MRDNRDLVLVVILAAICATLAPLVPVPAVSLVFAAPLALVLPGYAIAAAAFARQPLPPAHRAVLSVGLSLATIALVPLLLNLLPGGVSTGWWSVALFAVVLLAARAAAVRRPRRSGPSSWPRLPRVQALQAGVAAIGVLAGIAAVVLIYIPLPAPNANGYSELWIEPLDRERPTVRVGIGSREQEDATYTVELRVSGVERPFAIEQAFLRPGEETTVAVSTPAWLRRERVRVSATLFLAGEEAPYLRVAAWTPAAP